MSWAKNRKMCTMKPAAWNGYDGRLCAIITPTNKQGKHANVSETENTKKNRRITEKLARFDAEASFDDLCWCNRTVMSSFSYVCAMAFATASNDDDVRVIVKMVHERTIVVRAFEDCSLPVSFALHSAPTLTTVMCRRAMCRHHSWKRSPLLPSSSKSCRKNIHTHNENERQERIYSTWLCARLRLSLDFFGRWFDTMRYRHERVVQTQIIWQKIFAHPHTFTHQIDAHRGHRGTRNERTKSGRNSSKFRFAKLFRLEHFLCKRALTYFVTKNFSFHFTIFSFYLLDIFSSSSFLLLPPRNVC